ncbi:hypothetical protein OIDMADRAFT_21405, partial [Oidiodendron maius Zn]
MELRAGHFNSAARLVNATSSRCNQSISTFRGVDNERIPNFPVTCSQFSLLAGEDINHILERLQLDIVGTLARKRKRL